MLETPHVLVGAAIGTTVANPYLALPISLASHFVLDKVPHWNPHLNTDLEKSGRVSRKNTLFVIADASLALLSGTMIASLGLPDKRAFVFVLLSCLVAVLPDVVEAPHYFLNLRNKHITRFIKWQKSIQNDTGFFWGITTQIFVIFASLLVVWR